ncbi:MAG: ABC transporter permease [Defluviitoga tunisiensis]
MNSFEISVSNVKRNIKTYRLYLMAMIFSVMTYYNFSSMRFNQQFLEYKNAYAYIQSLSLVTSILMVMFLIFFIIYSSNFFLNQRKREIGIYAFMGIDNYKIAFIFALEGLLLGIVSLIFGLIFGIIFNKLFMMLLAKAALLNVRIDFYIAKESLIETAIVYSIIFVITFVKGFVDIIRTDLIDLMNSLKKEEALPKVNYFKAISSIVILAIAYWCAINQAKIGFDTALLISVLLVVWGTYWLFGAFFPMFMNFLVNRKEILYNGTNVISFSNLFFKIKENYKTLAQVAILVTICITSLGTVSSLKYYVNNNRKIEVPYSISFVSSNQEEIDKVYELLQNSNYKVKLKEHAKYLFDNQHETIIINYTTFNKILSDLNVENRQKILSQLQLSNNEAGYVGASMTWLSIQREKEQITIEDMKFTLKTIPKIPLFGNGLPYPCLVINDNEYDVLKTKLLEQQFNGIILENPENMEELTYQLASVLPEQSKLYTSYIADATFYDFTGIIYFLGFFLFLVFVFATASIIYFKILSESFGEKTKYEILQKIGATKSEIRHAISKYIATFFILPLIVGIVHSSVAIFVLSNLMNYNIIIHGIFYLIARRRYIQIIESN